MFKRIALILALALTGVLGASSVAAADPPWYENCAEDYVCIFTNHGASPYISSAYPDTWVTQGPTFCLTDEFNDGWGNLITSMVNNLDYHYYMQPFAEDDCTGYSGPLLYPASDPIGHTSYWWADMYGGVTHPVNGVESVLIQAY